MTHATPTRLGTQLRDAFTEFQAATPPSGGVVLLTLTVPHRFLDFVDTPADMHFWMRGQWAKVRARLARRGVSVRGVRMAEPHLWDSPKWNVILWVGSEAERACIEHALTHAWDGRWHMSYVGVQTAAGYVGKYAAKLAGSGAKPWAADWGIRLVSLLGVPAGAAREGGAA